ncbi:hypothetical protein AAMO2058_000401600 [Amorphochlora amoebiformis]
MLRLDRILKKSGTFRFAVFLLTMMYAKLGGGLGRHYLKRGNCSAYVTSRSVATGSNGFNLGAGSNGLMMDSKIRQYIDRSRSNNNCPRKRISVRSYSKDSQIDWNMRSIDVADLNQSQAELEMKEVTNEINQHDKLYYEGNPVLSDAQYDALAIRQKELEERFPHLKLPDSRQNRVGYKLEGGREDGTKITHLTQMLSLDNAFSEPDLDAWLSKLQRLLPEAELDFWAEPKIDGLSISLRYENGILTSCATRGDGFRGENVTDRAPALIGVPLILHENGRKLPSLVEVRGELYMSVEDFKTLNFERKVANESLFANPRNAASGSLRQLSLKDVRSRKLRFFAYDVSVVNESERLPSTQSGLMEWVESVGFNASRPSTRLPGDSKELIKYHKELEKARPNLTFEIDGAVFKLHDRNLQQKAGATAKAPRYAIAQKFQAEEAETTLEDYVIQVGRLGQLTPVGILKPTLITGATVSKATLHNFGFVNELGLRKGDTLKIRRSGDVIPQVLRVVKHGEGEVLRIPKNCPECGGIVIEEGARHMCTNFMGCKAQILETLKHLVGKKCLNIDGLGPQRLKYLIDKGYIEDWSDIFNLENKIAEYNSTSGETHPNIAPNGNGNISNLKSEDGNGNINNLHLEDGWGSKSVDKLLESIRAAKRPPLHRFIYAQARRNLGSSAAKKLASHFGESYGRWWGAVLDASKGEESDGYHELISIDQIGGKAVESMIETALMFREKSEKLARVLEIYENPVPPKPKPIEEKKKKRKSNKSEGDEKSAEEGEENTKDERGGGGGLSGKKFVITGIFQEVSREKVEAYLESVGAKVTGSVSKQTDAVIAGEKPGANKVNKARSLDVRVMSEEEFLSSEIFSPLLIKLEGPIRSFNEVLRSDVEK